MAGSARRDTWQRDCRDTRSESGRLLAMQYRLRCSRAQPPRGQCSRKREGTSVKGPPMREPRAEPAWSTSRAALSQKREGAAGSRPMDCVGLQRPAPTPGQQQQPPTAEGCQPHSITGVGGPGCAAPLSLMLVRGRPRRRRHRPCADPHHFLGGGERDVSGTWRAGGGQVVRRRGVRLISIAAHGWSGGRSGACAAGVGAL